MPRCSSRLLLTLACLVGSLFAHPLAAQTLRNGPGGEPPLELPRLANPVQVDGVIEDTEWVGAAEIEGVMHLPDPSQVRVTTLARDASIRITDACGMRLDTFNDEENSLMFNTTPAGVRTDWAFANDATGRPNRDWNTFWDAAGTMTDYGWSAEIRIPFSSLGFQVVDDRVVMGFSVARSIVRRNETTVHPAIPPNWGPASLAKPSYMRKMILRRVEPRKPVYVTPYALGGGGYTHALHDPGLAYVKDDDRVAEPGLDIRYGLTRNLNLSVNTDFAQVEASDLQVNLTRFSLFFPEKRRFFQERRAVFEVPLGGQERFFHSRRIGLVNGEPVRIFGGARMVGRVGDWDLGFIDMKTDDHKTSPGENLAVLRLRRRVLNDFSYLGGLVTSRLGDDGSYNTLYGADASVRLFGQDYLSLNWAQTFDDADPVSADPLDRSLIRVDWQRRGNRWARLHGQHDPGRGGVRAGHRLPVPTRLPLGRRQPRIRMAPRGGIGAQLLLAGSVGILLPAKRGQVGRVGDVLAEWATPDARRARRAI